MRVYMFYADMYCVDNAKYWSEIATEDTILLSFICALGVGMNAVPGGHFPLPAEVSHLMSRIPPPHCFNVRLVQHLLVPCRLQDFLCVEHSICDDYDVYCQQRTQFSMS